MEPEQLAHAVFEEMYRNDAFSQWLGIEALGIRPGYARLRMVVRPDMLNGFGIAHGGITFSLADSALAFASNSRGKKALSLDTSINHLVPVQDRTILVAEATEESLRNATGLYRVEVRNGETGGLVALFKGVVYRTSSDWFSPEDL